MVDELSDYFRGNRLGISFLYLRNFSIDRDFERAVNTVKSRISESPMGFNRRVIKSLDYISKKREVHLKAIIEVPLIVSTMVIDTDTIKSNDINQYKTRQISARINLQKRNILLFTYGQKEVRIFANYLRDITAMGFDPVQIKYQSDHLTDLIKEFDRIKQLKVVTKNSKSTRFMRFSGENLLESSLVDNILSDMDNQVVEFAGIRTLVSGEKVKIHLNNRGRMWLYANPNELSDDDIFELIQDTEMKLLQSDIPPLEL